MSEHEVIKNEMTVAFTESRDVALKLAQSEAELIRANDSVEKAGEYYRQTSSDLKEVASRGIIDMEVYLKHRVENMQAEAKRDGYASAANNIAGRIYLLRKRKSELDVLYQTLSVRLASSGATVIPFRGDKDVNN